MAGADSQGAAVEFDSSPDLVSSEIRRDQRVRDFATVGVHCSCSLENTFAIGVENLQRRGLVVAGARRDLAKRALFNEKRNLERSIMPPKADEAFSGVVAPARVWEIQCHFASIASFLLAVLTFLAGRRCATRCPGL